MNAQRSKPGQHSNGSVYLVTLVTTAAIVSMVFIGIGLRSAQSSSSSIVTQMTTTNEVLLDATEYAFQSVFEDPIWIRTAQSGNIFPTLSPFVKEDTVYAGTVVDADTDGLPDLDTTNYRLKISATSNALTSVAQIDMLATRVDYQGYLDEMDATHYWSLGEFGNPEFAVDEIDGIDGTYLVPSVAGAGVNDQGGLVPVFSDADDCINVPWDETFKTPAGSISLWMNFAGGDESSSDSILGMMYSSGGVLALNLSIYRNAVVAYIDDDNFWFLPSAVLTPSGSITPGNWHHIVMTWGSGGLTVYLDGASRARNSFNRDGLSTAAVPSGGNQPLHIGGGYYIGSRSAPEDGFNGSVAHVAFFERQLSEKEVADLAAVLPDLSTYSLIADSWVRVYEE